MIDIDLCTELFCRERGAHAHSKRPSIWHYFMHVGHIRPYAHGFSSISMVQAQHQLSMPWIRATWRLVATCTGRRVSSALLRSSTRSPSRSWFSRRSWMAWRLLGSWKGLTRSAGRHPAWSWRFDIVLTCFKDLSVSISNLGGLFDIPHAPSLEKLEWFYTIDLL